MDEIILIGAGPTALHTIDFINAYLSDRYRVVGLLDDNESLIGTERFGVPVLGNIESARDYPDGLFNIQIANDRLPIARVNLAQRIGIPRERYCSIILPHSFISPSAQIGFGANIRSYLMISANATLGDHAMVLFNTSIGHDVVIGDGVTVGNGVSIGGHVVIEDGVYIGQMASINPHVHVGKGAVIGSAANVTKDVQAGEVVAGNPARVLRKMT